jgi:nicotinate-nucleotide adenylyltransferase
MSKPQPRVAVGVMGGTFDPIHYGHLVAAEAVRHMLGLQRVVFVPAGHPPHKLDRPVTEGRHRYLMTVMATVTNPHFEVSRVEVDRPGPSYTVDTMRTFRRTLGPEAELWFITGLDAVREILTWHEPKVFLSLCHVAAVTRPGYAIEEAQRVREKMLSLLGEGHPAPRFEVFEVPALAISSSDIRRRVREGEPIKYLLPDTVETYIEKMGLYRPEAAARDEL